MTVVESTVVEKVEAPKVWPEAVMDGVSPPYDASPIRLSDRVRAEIRARHYSRRTEQAYLHWIRRFWQFAGRRDPASLGDDSVRAFLNGLAVNEDVAASTQNQASSALLFLYRHVLGQDMPWLDRLVRAERPRRLPAVLSAMNGLTQTIASMLHGSCRRLLEACRLRLNDVEVHCGQLLVRAGKGNKDRSTSIPGALIVPLRNQLGRVRKVHRRDLALGAGAVELPKALARKGPGAARELPWEWLFPATRTFPYCESGETWRHHLHETVVQPAVGDAVRASGIAKRATSHTLRYSFATHSLEDGDDIRTVQKLLGHRNVRTTMIRTHVLGDRWAGVRSPIAALTGSDDGVAWHRAGHGKERGYGVGDEQRRAGDAGWADGGRVRSMLLAGRWLRCGYAAWIGCPSADMEFCRIVVS